jgi:hypothetical protein
MSIDEPNLDFPKSLKLDKRIITIYKKRNDSRIEHSFAQKETGRISLKPLPEIKSTLKQKKSNKD